LSSLSFLLYFSLPIFPFSSPSSFSSFAFSSFSSSSLASLSCLSSSSLVLLCLSNALAHIATSHLHSGTQSTLSASRYKAAG
jgi:hypothetical protein